MSLHSGIDTVAFVSRGLFTKTYGASDQPNINSLFLSRGLIEKAVAAVTAFVLGNLFPGRISGRPTGGLSGAAVIGPREDIIF